MFVCTIGVLPSLDSHSKHNMVHGKLNFKWNCKAAKVDLIPDELSNVNWNNLFHNLNVNEMCPLFTDVLLGVISINISNKTIKMLRGLLPLFRQVSSGVTEGYIVNGSNVAEILQNTKVNIFHISWEKPF